MPLDWNERLSQQFFERARLGLPDPTHLIVSPATELAIKADLTPEERLATRSAEAADDGALWMWGRPLRVVANSSINDGVLILVDQDEYAIWFKKKVADSQSDLGARHPKLRA